MNVNLVVLGGNLTHDPDMKYSNSGTAILNFSIANNRVYTKDGEKVTEVSFIGLTAFGKTAENIAKYFQKGSPIMVEGRIKTDQWEDSDGKKKSKTKVIVDRFHLCGGKKKEEDTDTPQEEIAWDDDK